MSLKILLPILYLLIGYLLSFGKVNIKKIASATLSKLVIPYVIIHHIVMNQQGMFTVINGTIAIMAVMLFIGRRISKDPIKLLCFFYLNIGWLGLPIATALFGHDVAGFIIAAYVGSSLFGNIVGTGLLANNTQSSASSRLISLLKSPPFIALVLGFCLMPFAQKFAVIDAYLYAPAKFLMAFLGMMVLGMWLEETKINKEEIGSALTASSIRIVILGGLMVAILYMAEQANVEWIAQYSQVLFLICLLPPAANIVILETHYLNTGKSASMISIGTCFSILLIAIYAVLLILLN